MRIGLDIDDTICNTNEVLMKYAHRYNAEHGNKPLLKSATNNFAEVFGWNDNEVYTFFRTYYLVALKEIFPKENVKEVLSKLKAEGNEIFFITVRNDRECGGEGEACRITTEWFNKYDIPYDKIYYDVYDKATFCKEHNIDAFMDDSTKTVRLVSSEGIRTFIAMNNFNADFEDSDITKIYSLNEFYEEIHLLQDLKNKLF